MRFAVHNEHRVEATPGAVGLCPGCSAELTAKCGTKKVWHWAHKGQRHCDHWWEPETEWHRSWKDRFPKEWQERSARDDRGELHIADVRTPHGLVVEFQYSYIKPEEALKRTEFHAPMLWVVSGERRPTDRRQFDELFRYRSAPCSGEPAIDRFSVYDARLLQEWADLGVIVAFDFGAEDVWLMSGRDWACALGRWFKKDDLVAHIRDGTPIPHVIFEHHHPRTRKVINRTHTIRNSLPKP
ncbi:competence protein CoiA [Roseinatronobacter sp. S2]|uniref:competence protein CoiA n=1 Tax=Roseinatronobacter sp. S2 TaxID=3035471 RepID=UPI00358EA7DD